MSEPTLYKWLKKYGGMEVNDEMRLKALEKENTQLKKLVADLSLDKRVLEDLLRKKLLTPKARRNAVMYAMESFGLSECKSCMVVNMNRSSKQYKVNQRDDCLERGRIRELAEKHNRYGSPRIHALLRREGITINHKRTERIYREERLSLRRKKRKKLLGIRVAPYIDPL